MREPALQPESPLYNQNPHFTTHKPFQNPYFAPGCERLLTSVLTDNVKAWNLQHHPLQQPCRLESLAIYVYVCVCTYTYVYIYIYTHTCIIILA